MTLETGEMSAPRKIRTFEPDPDVARMLERATAQGIKITFILNSAAREWLTKKGFARKKDTALAA